MHHPIPPTRRSRVARGVLAALATGALGLTGIAGATAANAAPTAGTISGATLTWGLSDEAGGGAFFGGCNFLSAGAAGNTGASRLWTEADGFYSTQVGDVSVKKPAADGSLVSPTWATKCQTPQGGSVVASNTASKSGNVVVLSNGTGTSGTDGSTTVSWDGSFTVVFYGGQTYWTATDPVLSIDADGNGTLKATASGYGASMEDTTKWEPITPRTITLATIAGATDSDTGLTTTPAYAGVAVTVSGTPQNTTKAGWGSFPQDFIAFQELTGQSSYWYTSGGSRDAAKAASPLTVAYTVGGGATPPVTPPAADDEQHIDVAVPTVAAPPSGSFGWRFASDSPVDLGTAIQAGSTFTARGALNPIVVTDTRTGGSGAYTWTVSGQVSEFASATDRFSAGYLGWTPSVRDAGTGVTAGAAVTSTVAGGAGLGSSAVLASSTAAAGATVGAELALSVPTTTKAGDYRATLTVTALS